MSDELLNKIIQELLSTETIDIDDIVFLTGGVYVLPQEILELIKGYLEQAEENLTTAEQALPAQLEAIKAILAGKED